MKAFFSLIAIILIGMPSIVMADTYTGVVSDVKKFHNGGVAVNLDGKWPDQKMTFYIPPEDATGVGALPPEGAMVTASGTTTQYRGKPEIKIHTPNQWKW